MRWDDHPASQHRERSMSHKYTALFVVVAALTALPTFAQAADGCGRGFYYNGSRCVPKHDTDYRPRHRDRGVSVGVGPNMRLVVPHSKFDTLMSAPVISAGLPRS